MRYLPNSGRPAVRPFITIIVAACLGAAAATALSTARPLEEHAVDLRLGQALPGMADELSAEPAAVRAAFTEFADDEELALGARLALLRHPRLARRVIPMYADSAAFRLVLRRHGPAVIPPIHYFLTHEPASLRLRARLAAWIDQAHGDGGTGSYALSPRERGRYAIEFIRREGHDFLGQFVTARSGEVHWIQSERLATETKRFFTSGLVSLETKRRLGEETRADDYGWAAVDLLLPFAAVKAARIGKAATRTGRAARATRATGLAATAARTGRLARFTRTAARAGVVAGTAYVVMNPGVISSIGAELAHWTGMPAWLVIAGLWFLLLAPVLLVLRFAYRWFVRPLVPRITFPRTSPG